MNEPANWSEHSARQITAAGLRRSTPRQRVIDLLADRDCAVTALEIDAELEGVGRATVYRAIERQRTAAKAELADASSRR